MTKAPHRLSDAGPTSSADCPSRGRTWTLLLQRQTGPLAGREHAPESTPSRPDGSSGVGVSCGFRPAQSPHSHGSSHGLANPDPINRPVPLALGSGSFFAGGAL